MFPRGVPLVRSAEPAPPRETAAAAIALASEEGSDATTGEGGLRNEKPAIRDETGAMVPEAGQNLLEE